MTSRGSRPAPDTTAVDTSAGPDWEQRVPDAEWRVYQRVAREAHASGIPFAFGGAFATAVYTGVLRNTKDFDLYILPQDRAAMQDAIGRAGLHDHFETLPYDRSWIYRASLGDVVVDAIWAMANQRASVDRLWLSRGPMVQIRGEQMRAIPVEELIWSKLYVLQRERSDWGDVLNLIAARAGSIDWDHLRHRLSQDAPLLAGALAVFGWLDPKRAQHIPPRVWGGLGLEPPLPPGYDSPVPRDRADLLDSRAWFLPASR